MSSSDVTSRLLGALANRREGQKPSEVSQQRWSYREAAAVLVAFRPQFLNPVDERFKADNPYLLLFSDLVSAPGGRDRMLMTLKPDVRRQTLLRMGSTEALMRALDANPARELNEAQELFEQWLTRTQPPIEIQNYRQLTLSTEIIEFLRDVVPELPPAQELRDALSRKSVVSSFEHLATDRFVGRQKELQSLGDYVGVLPSTGIATALRLARQFLGLQSRPPLMLYGPGGTGKSALLGRFLLDHVNLEPALRFPFAYLAFDNPALRVSDPFTLVVEAAAQLQTQFPEHRAVYEDFHKEMQAYRDERARLLDRGTAIVSPSARVDSVGQLNQHLYSRFADMTRVISQRDNRQAPTLLVFDTFEEVQYRDAEQLLGLWRMLEIMQKVNPLLRILISGRVKVEGLSINGSACVEMPLGELAMEHRVALLRELGITDEEAAHAVAVQVGGNPLTLRLAARVMQAEAVGKEGIAGLQTRRFLLFAVSEELVRGQLYMRVLDHIHDPEVRSLAHPGMVLRRITPEIIREVLADVVGVDASEPGRPEALFKELRHEYAVVTIAADESLHYRPEVRRPMLELLKQDRPSETREIHQRAIQFYRSQPGESPINRAEEIYHTLMLDEDTESLDGRWLEGVGELLIESLEELPAPGIAWLAARMSLHVDEQVIARAGVATWERHIGRKVRQLLRYSSYWDAQRLLQERPERTRGSPLYALEARVLFALDNPRGAIELLDHGIGAGRGCGTNRGRLAEMLWVKAVILEQGLNDPAGADDALVSASSAARRIESSLSRLQICTQRCALRHKYELPHDESLVPALAQALADLDDSEMSKERGIVRKAIGFTGADYPLTFRRALRVVDLTTDPDRVPEALAVLERFVSGPPLWSKADDVDWWNLGNYVDLISPLDREPDPKLIGELADFLKKDTSTLSAMSLSGIDDYREPWELEAAPEAVP